MLTAVASAFAMPPGSRRLVTVDGRRILVVVDGDGVHALLDECPHYGVPLSDGRLRNGVVECPWHGWRFDVRTGECLHNRSAVTTFPAFEQDGRLYVETPVVVRSADG